MHRQQHDTFVDAGGKLWCSAGLGPRSNTFSYLINDMPLFINEAYAEVYADDTTVHAAHKDQNVVETKLQNSAIHYKSWCIQHKMFVNLTKTSFITIGTRQNLSNIHDINIIIDNEHISNVDNQKLLGIIIDKTLSWEKQIDSVCLNITRRITFLKMLSRYVDRSSLKQYYTSYSYSPLLVLHTPHFWLWLHVMGTLHNL